MNRGAGLLELNTRVQECRGAGLLDLNTGVQECRGAGLTNSVLSGANTKRGLVQK